MERTYVIQVETGRETRAKELIEHIVGQPLAREVFVPQWEKAMSVRGGGIRMQHVLLTPGYLYLTTSDVDAAFQALRAVPAFTRLLGGEGGFVPLTPDELVWVDQLTKPGERTVRMSHAIKEGDTVRIVDGPLVGFETKIKRIDAHKRLAYVALPLLGRPMTVKVGLEVIRKTDFLLRSYNQNSP